LIADEVIELLKKHVITTPAERQAFQQLLDDSKLTNAYITDPQTQVPLLKKCRDFLQSKGIYVFLGFECYEMFSDIYACLIAGKCGLVFHTLHKQSRQLDDLYDFIYRNKSKLPPNLVLKSESIFNLLNSTWRFTAQKTGYLMSAYTKSDKRGLERVCRRGWRLANKIDAFLENLKDLQLLRALENL
jgi:hypothetical protein